MATWPKPTIQALPDQVAQLVLDRIAAGELEAGQRLPSQRGLAQSLGVGLAVVREAVQRLEALNILETTHGSGTVVQPFRWIPLIYDPTLFKLAVQRIGIRDLWETRQLLEGQIIRLAAQRATEDDLAAIRGVLARAEPLPKTYVATQKLNREFHLAVARATGNIVLEDMLSPLLEIRVDGVEQRFTAAHCRAAWEAHRRMYDAVAAHDLRLADRAIEHHFTVGPVALIPLAPRAGRPRRAARRMRA